MDWRAKYEAQMKADEAEVKKLMADPANTPEVLKKRFLRNFGCINFKSDEWMHELELARAYHRILIRLPEEAGKHKSFSREPYRCYCETGCSCGFCEACDSSD